MLLLLLLLVHLEIAYTAREHNKPRKSRTIRFAPPRAGGGGGSTPLPPATLASPAARPLRIPYVDITVLISSPHIKSRKVRFISRNVYRYRFHGARVASAQVQVVFRGSKTVISH